MEIRRAKDQDCAAIAEIWNHYIRHTEVTFTTAQKTAASIAQDMAQKATNNEPYFVACTRTGSVIGFATYGPFRNGPGYAYAKEHTINLKPQSVQRGAGRALMEALITHAQEAGVHSLYAGISHVNTAGQAFHRKIGFETVAVLPEVGCKFGKWFDLVLMLYRPDQAGDPAPTTRPAPSEQIL